MLRESSPKSQIAAPKQKEGKKTATLIECVLPKIPFYLKWAHVCVIYVWNNSLQLGES